MSQAASIAGEANSGRQAQAKFPFYAGLVGIRERDGWMDVAFFAPEVRAKLPVDGLIDGRHVRVTALATRPLDPAARGRGTMCAITATVFTED